MLKIVNCRYKTLLERGGGGQQVAVSGGPGERESFVSPENCAILEAASLAPTRAATQAHGFLEFLTGIYFEFNYQEVTNTF